MITIAFTYSTITPESAENGDFEDHGYYEPGGWRYSVRNSKIDKDIQENIQDYVKPWKIGDLKSALQSAENLGIYCPSELPPIDKYMWFSSEYHIEDYSSAEQIEYSLHVNGVTNSTMRRIYRILNGQPIFGNKE